MINNLNHCADFLTASGTSSCTEHLDNRCQRIFNTTGANGQCCFINDHTYTILKKICRRIFKDYTRAQCRKKYTILEGGNSVNVRIYRSRQHGDGNVKNDQKGQYNRNKLNQNIMPNDISKSNFEGSKISKNIQNNSNRYTGKKRNTDIDSKVNENTYHESSKNKRSLDKKSKNKSTKGDSDEYNDDEDIESARKKLKKGTSKKGTLLYNEEDNTKDRRGRKRMDSKDYGDKEYERKLGKQKGKSKQKQGTIEDDIDGKTTSDKNGTKSGKNKKNTLKTLGDSEYADNDDDFGGTSKNRRKLSSNRGKAKDYKINYIDQNRKSFLKNQNLSETGNRLIKDLRKKIRQGESLRMEDYDPFPETARRSLKSRLSKTNKSYNIINQISRNLRYRNTKSSRVDEIKTCDYLRAQMEQRELDQVDCRTQLHQFIPVNCNRQVYNPSLCTCPEESCYPKSRNFPQN